MSGKKGKAGGVPVWVVDGFEELEAAADNLSRAVECAGVAMRTEFADPADFMRGTLDVLMLAAEDVRKRAARMRRKAERRMA